MEKSTFFRIWFPLILCIVGVVGGWTGSWFAIYKKEINSLKAKNEALREVVNDAIMSFKDKAYKYYNQGTYKQAEKYAQNILLLDENNGHGLYLLGECLKYSDRIGSNNAFEKYIKNWCDIPPKKRRENKVKGYDDERTAWVALSLADSYLKEAKVKNDIGLIKKACKLLLFSESIRPQGFSKPISTGTVRKNIEKILEEKCGPEVK